MTKSLTAKDISATLADPIELNHSYMPFITGGGIFIQTTEPFALGDLVSLALQLPEDQPLLHITGKVIWITPKHALYQAMQGIGIQFIGPDAPSHCQLIEAHLDPNHEVGGYAYWIDEDINK